MPKRILKKILNNMGYNIITKTEQKELDFYRYLNPASLIYSVSDQSSRELIAPLLPFSKAQLAQDLFAIVQHKNCSSPGFFVEFGATDGVTCSNTWMLEVKLGWGGILAEPAKIWHQALSNNRNCSIDYRCVAPTSGKMLRFTEVKNTYEASAELSTISKYSNNGDWASGIRGRAQDTYNVESISLEDLLDTYNAPGTIDFLSIDTEGSELDILKSYDFKSKNRKILAICVEHNFVQVNRSAINRYLADSGYKQVFSEITKWDDWYVLSAG